MPQTYSKRLGLLPNPAVAAEIARLDSRQDCQRIAHLLSGYEFPGDYQRALELALFYTYGSASLSALLDGTGEFRKNGQKRYDDPRFLAAIGVRKPPFFVRPLLETTLRALGRVKRMVAPADYPARPDSAVNRTYGKGGYRIEELRPARFREDQHRH